MNPLINLEAIEIMRYKSLREKVLYHALEWNIKKRCECVKGIKNPSLDNLKVCIHIQRASIKKFHKKMKESLSNSLYISKLDIISDLTYLIE